MNKRPILIAGALKKEIDELVKFLNNMVEKKIGFYNVYEGEINNYPIIIVKTEIGIANAASAISLAIDKYDPLFIINEGTAGGITKEHHKKDIVIAQKCININSYRSPYKEIGEGSDSRDWELMSFKDGGEDKLEILDSNIELIDFIIKMKDEYKDGNVFQGIVGSGDAWNREKDRLNHLYENYGIACEDMEAYSIYQIANNYKIPMIAIKIMSDNELLGEEYEPEVGTICQEFVKKVLDKLTKSDEIVENLK